MSWAAGRNSSSSVLLALGGFCDAFPSPLLFFWPFCAPLRSLLRPFPLRGAEQSCINAINAVIAGSVGGWGRGAGGGGAVKQRPAGITCQGSYTSWSCSHPPSPAGLVPLCCLLVVLCLRLGSESFRTAQIIINDADCCNC